MVHYLRPLSCRARKRLILKKKIQLEICWDLTTTSSEKKILGYTFLVGIFIFKIHIPVRNSKQDRVTRVSSFLTELKKMLSQETPLKTSDIEDTFDLKYLLHSRHYFVLQCKDYIMKPSKIQKSKFGVDGWVKTIYSE